MPPICGAAAMQANWIATFSTIRAISLADEYGEVAAAAGSWRRLQVQDSARLVPSPAHA